MSPDQRDRLYAAPQEQVLPFRFDAAVAQVFPDMIRRSVPGYAAMVEMTGVIAGRHAQPGSTLYDLGCSLGAVTLAMRHQALPAGCRIVAVDNAAAMLERARELIAADTATAGSARTAVDLRCEDIRDTVFADASVVALNFTLQFVPREDRTALLARIARGMRPGGVLVLSEKIRFDDPQEQRRNEELHHAFKRSEGYSELEIAQKRNALEDVLIPETLGEHVARLHDAGFTGITPWFRCFNFMSLVAYGSAAPRE
ncbi:MAG: carboxy-S-adenosyl-L-methionine synthase CmoA [Pseudomonadota bacterium]